VTEHAVVRLIFAAIVGAVIVGFVALALPPRDGDPGRLVEVDVSGLEPFEPVLFEEDDFYLVMIVGDGKDGTSVTWRAIYPVDTHPVFGLERGCRVRWEPDGKFPRSDPQYHGVFREPCGGSVFNRDGTRVFGPAPRDLDRFPWRRSTGTPDSIVVDTSRLICGPPEPLPGHCRRTLAE
jgi:Rieske Fe-S protein